MEPWPITKTTKRSANTLLSQNFSPKTTLQIELVAATVLHVGCNEQPRQGYRNQTQNNSTQQRLNHFPFLLLIELTLQQAVHYHLISHQQCASPIKTCPSALSMSLSKP